MTRVEALKLIDELHKAFLEDEGSAIDWDNCETPDDVAHVYLQWIEDEVTPFDYGP